MREEERAIPMPGELDEGSMGWARALPPLVAALAVASGVLLRVPEAGGIFLAGDEFHTLELSRASYAAILSNLDRKTGGIALPLLQRIGFDLFGPGLWAFRLPALAGGVLALLLMYPVARRFVGAPPAAVATLALCLNPVHVFYSHFARAYALFTLLALCLVYALRRVTEAPAAPTPRGWLAVVAACVALLPYVHLMSPVLVLCAVGGAGLAFLSERRDPAALVPLGVAVALGGLLSLALYLPAWEALWHFVAIKAAKRADVPLSLAFDVATRLAGGRPAAILWMVGLPLASLWMLRVRRSVALLLVPVALGPILYAMLRPPEAGIYSNARYLLATLPFQFLILAWALDRGTRALALGSPRGGVAALGLGVAVVAAGFWFGPLGRDHVDDGPFANRYRSMHRARPRADRPFDGTPDFYRTLAKLDGPVHVIEAPLLTNRLQSLYRNYYLQHRKRTSLGTFRSRPLPTLPYVDLRGPEGLAASDVDYLIVHLDVDVELRRNLGVERAGLPNPVADAVAATPETPRHVVVRRLARKLGLGRPIHVSEDLAVWKFSRDADAAVLAPAKHRG